MIVKKKNIGTLIKTTGELLLVAKNKQWLVDISQDKPRTIVAEVVAHYPLVKVLKLIKSKELYRYIKNK